MSEEHMPATEATAVADDESSNYELAFHILPTVAEEEVKGVQDALKEMITNAGGMIDAEEAAARYDLAYDIEKEVEGKRSAFDTSYFGWIRFTGTPDILPELHVELNVRPDILRYIIVKLTREEAAHPYMVHEVRSKMPETVGDEGVENTDNKEGTTIESKTSKEDTSEKVEDGELDESLGKITQ